MDHKTPGKGGRYVVDPLTNQLREIEPAAVNEGVDPAELPAQTGLMDEEEVY